jgi:hypothetical protein
MIEEVAQEDGQRIGNRERVDSDAECESFPVFHDVVSLEGADAAERLGQEHDEKSGHPVGEVDRLVGEERVRDGGQAFGCSAG